MKEKKNPEQENPTAEEQETEAPAEQEETPEEETPDQENQEDQQETEGEDQEAPADEEEAEGDEEDPQDQQEDQPPSDGGQEPASDENAALKDQLLQAQGKLAAYPYTVEHDRDIEFLVDNNPNAQGKWAQPWLPGGDLVGFVPDAFAGRFVFFHEHDNLDLTADPFYAYPYGISESTEHGRAFIELMRRYPNAIWFHGHTHNTFEADHYSVATATARGYKSVNIPSLQGPRKFSEGGNFTTLISEGYIVDVYPNHLVLRALDFNTVNADGTGTATEMEAYVLDTTI